MSMRRKGSKGKWPGKFRKGLSLALCAAWQEPELRSCGIGGHRGSGLGGRVIKSDAGSGTET